MIVVFMLGSFRLGQRTCWPVEHGKDDPARELGDDVERSWFQRPRQAGAARRGQKLPAALRGGGLQGSPSHACEGRDDAEGFARVPMMKAPLQPQEVDLTARTPQVLAAVVGSEPVERLIAAGDLLASSLGSARIFNINSTAAGGGVAEM